MIYDTKIPLALPFAKGGAKIIILSQPHKRLDSTQPITPLKNHYFDAATWRNTCFYWLIIVDVCPAQ